MINAQVILFNVEDKNIEHQQGMADKIEISEQCVIFITKWKQKDQSINLIYPAETEENQTIAYKFTIKYFLSLRKYTYIYVCTAQVMILSRIWCKKKRNSLLNWYIDQSTKRWNVVCSAILGLKKRNHDLWQLQSKFNSFYLAQIHFFLSIGANHSFLHTFFRSSHDQSVT